MLSFWKHPNSVGVGVGPSHQEVTKPPQVIDDHVQGCWEASEWWCVQPLSWDVSSQPSGSLHPSPHRLMDADRKHLWEKRYYCHLEVSSLPLVLASAPSWEWACLPDIYALLKQWPHMNHQDALGLLHAT